MNLSDKLRKTIGDRPKPNWSVRPEVLLCPNVPKPLHGVAPRVVLGTKWWNKTRQEAYRSTDFHCIACGVNKYHALGRQWLEGHEYYSIDYVKGRMTYIETLPLCHYCHNFIHDGRLLSLLEQRKIAQQKYAAIIQHGESVLARAGLRRLTIGERDRDILGRPLADWEDWRLVIDGKEYPPLYKTFDEWKEAHSR